MTGLDNNGKSPENLLTFPCQYQVKAMGRHDGGFQTLVCTVVGRHLDGGEILETKIRASTRRSYISVSCTIEVVSRAQLDAIYLDLNSEAEVLVTL